MLATRSLGKAAFEITECDKVDLFASYRVPSQRVGCYVRRTEGRSAGSKTFSSRV
jgi:hypothetical protein